MCPACIASSVLMVALVMSSGGLTALATRLFQLKNSGEKISLEEPKREEK
jgi:hypothetical protein